MGAVVEQMDYDVILIALPFFPVDVPILGPSLLSAGVREKGFGCRTYYANLVMAAEIGLESYQRLASITPHPRRPFVHEALFFLGGSGEGSEYGRSNKEVEEILRDFLQVPMTPGVRNMNRNGRIIREDTADCLTAVPRFLERVCREVLRCSPKIVGFSSSFYQNMGAMALARRIKREAPNVVTVFGGANADAPMGEAVGKATGVFDFVFSGEADMEFPGFVEKFLNGGELPHQQVIHCKPVMDLDCLSPPYYGDYLEQLSANFPSEVEEQTLPTALFFESSRGCWWAAKTKCTFCGADSSAPRYAAKQSERVRSELYYLAGKYHVKSFMATDSIIPSEHLTTLVPMLAEKQDNGLEIRHLIRADLKTHDLDNLMRAGITRVTCGIESFSTPLLRRMRKGVVARQNLVLLRDCMSRAIIVDYELLAAVPGDKAEDYRSMIRLIPKIVHLFPPAYIHPIQILRFSSYHAFPEAYEIKNLRPCPEYGALFGRDAALEDLAYYFEAEFRSGYLEEVSMRAEFEKVTAQWITSWTAETPPPVLRKLPAVSGVQIVQDTRPCGIEEFYTPTEEELILLDHFSNPRRLSVVPGHRSAALENLAKRLFIVEHEGFLLTVVTKPSIRAELESRPNPLGEQSGAGM